jgi:hypothetical protein
MSILLGVKIYRLIGSYALKIYSIYYGSEILEISTWGKFFQKMNTMQVYQTTVQNLTHLPPDDRRCRALFGASLEQIVRVDSIVRPNVPIAPTDLLIALHFLKCYQTEDVATTSLFSMDRKKYRTIPERVLKLLNRRLPGVCL